MCFTAKLMAFSKVAVTMPVDFSDLDFEVYKFVIRRQSFTFFWSSLQVYRLLKLSSYKGQPSKWAGVSKQNWRQWCEEAGLSTTHVQLSAQCTTQPGDSSSVIASLPTPCLSTSAFVLVLGKLGVAVVRRGGLRTTNGQEKAKSLVTQLLRAAAASRRWTVQLRFLSPWVSSWPITEPERPDVQMFVGPSPALLVDVSPWRQIIDDGHEMALEWWNHAVAGAETLVGGKLCVPLPHLLARSIAITSSDQSLQSLHRQMVWQIGRLIESSMQATLSSTDTPAAGSISCKQVELQELMDDERLMLHELLRYKQSGISALRGTTHLSMTHDKGNVAGLQLQTAAIFRGNIGALCLPMVSSVSCDRATYTSRVAVCVVMNGKMSGKRFSTAFGV